MKRFLILLTAALAFVAAARDFTGPEAHLYYAYTASLVEDGDLNIANQLADQSGGPPVVTRHFQYPDFHNHGGVVFWAPFYLLGRVLPSTMALSTLLFALVALFLCHGLAARLAPARDAGLATALVFFGGPLFYYTLWEPGNANVVALLAVTLVLAALVAEEDPLVVGVLAGVAAVVKIDCWFLLPVAALRGPRRFVTGCLPVIALKVVNDTIRYGGLRFGELQALSPHGTYFWEQAFSTYHGFFFCSPLLLLALVGIAREPRLRPFGVCLLVKCVAIGSRYAWGGGSFGARILLTETPIFICGLAWLLGRARGPAKHALVAACAALVGWNLFMATLFAASAEGPLVEGRVPFGTLARSAGEFLARLSLPTFDARALVALGVLALLPFRRVSFRAVAVVAGAGYAALTIANVLNTDRNIGRLRSAGYFAHAAVVGSDHAERAENRDSVREMIQYYSARADRRKVDELTALEARLAAGQ